MELKVDPRVENLKKARAARKLKAEQKKEEEPHNGNGMLLEPTFDIERRYEMLGALTNDFLTKNFTEKPLLELCNFMRETLDRCAKRLQVLENNRTALHCDHCKRVLPGGRFAGEIVVRNEITQELQALRQMLLIRRFEEKAGQMYGMGLIGGFCHLYIGQEAVVVGMKLAAREGDQMITGYRDHGHMLACDMDPKGVMAELTGRRDGYSKGKGGSMHMFSLEKKFYGGHGIVGAQVPLGTGLAAHGRRLRERVPELGKQVHDGQPEHRRPCATRIPARRRPRRGCRPNPRADPRLPAQ